MKEKARNRKLRKRSFSGKELFVLIAIVEPKEEYQTESKRCLKKYYVCLRDDKEYYHIRTEKKITKGMEDKYYTVIYVQTISNFTEYIEDTISQDEKENLSIDVNEIFDLEDILNLVANVK